MNPYQMTFAVVLGSMAFWGGMALMAVVMLGLNLTTLRLQVIDPPKRQKLRKVKRLTGVASELLWPTLESWDSAGWEVVLYHEQKAVGLYTVILKQGEL